MMKRKRVSTLTYLGRSDKLIVLPFWPSDSPSPRLGKNKECQIDMLTEKLTVECQKRLDEYGSRWFMTRRQGSKTRYVFGGRRCEQ